MAAVITKESCEVILQNYLKSKDFQIEDYNVESLASKVYGMMAEYHMLHLKFKFGGKSDNKSFFCKKLVMFHKIQEIMGKEQGAYEKENYIYNYLIKECRKASKFDINFAAECYLALKDDIFVLEDLSGLGYVLREDKHDLAHCKVVLRAIADFHATSIIYEETQTLKRGKKFSLFEEQPDMFKDSLYRRDENYLGHHWYKNCIGTLLKIADICKIPNIDNNKLKEKILEYSEKVYDILTPSKSYVNAVCHGDLSKVNMLFKYDDQKQPTHCKLVDFQAIKYLPPAQDVMSYIYLNTETAFRKKYMNELLEYYHQIFHLELDRYSINKDKHIVLERFHESCEYVLPQIVLQTLCYDTMIPINLAYPEMKNDQELYKKYVYEDRSPQCLQVYKNGGLFKNCINEMFQELYEL